MRRFRRKALALAGALTLGSTLAIPSAADDEMVLVTGEVSQATATAANKIDVMGIWAHPDDDASFTTPCGVWHERYDVDCGIIMLTRGEGGSNSVGDEAGPDLGLRRENEDRASHYRSGTVDIYNIDAVDFFYNTSAVLTEEVWGSERIQRQVVHVIRQTQPEILTGFSPAPAGHGNHQYAGRVIWEAAAMAADPTAFPEQLTGPDAVDTWQVKMITSGAGTQGSGGSLTENCNTGFVPAATNPFTVVGTWTGFDSPITWLEGNVQGQTPGTFMTWAHAGREGNRAHPTQARSKAVDIFSPSCQRYGIAHSEVPFQPNGSEDNGRDDAILFGSVIADPGGMALGSTYRIDVADYFQAPNEAFEVTVSSRSGEGTVGAGEVVLNVPAGWSVSAAQTLGPITTSADASATFTVTPAADAANGRYKLSAEFDNGTVTAYNDTRVEIVPGVEGRFERWGNYSAYDEWAEQFTWVAGRSGAESHIGAGESVTVPVVVTNRTTAAQSGEVTLSADAPFIVEPASIDYSSLPAGESTTVEFTLTHTDPSDLGGVIVELPITTTADAAGSTSSENLRMYVVPTTVIPQAEGAPEIDGEADDFYGDPIDIGRRWEGSACNPDGTDCGEGSFARLAWSGDDLYVYAYVVDDVVSAAATTERCFGHWLVDSVEVLLDPAATSRDTSTTFKTGIMPFTDDPTGAAGNGVNGPCWSRDADNHQGFSSGPLADTIEGAPNSPGQEVAVSLVRNADGTYEGGGYAIETKIPLANLPAAVGPTSTAPTGDSSDNDVDPVFMGLNVTPYDSDVQTFIGKTRTAWSPFGSQQSEPYRWGHAYLDGYEPPADRSAEPAEPIIPDTALKGVESPQTIHQSAVRGVTISGLAASRALDIDEVTFDDSGADIQVSSTEAGTVRAYAWSGMIDMVPVWLSSCVGDELGFSTCVVPDDLGAAPWAPDMGGRLQGSVVADVGTGDSTVRLALDTAALQALTTEGALLISYESASGAVDAWHYELKQEAVPGPVTIVAHTAGTKLVGNDTNLWGTAIGAEGEAIVAEVLVGDGWVEVGSATVAANGSYVLPLSGDEVAARGEYTLRVRVGEDVSNEFSFTRIARSSVNAAPTAPLGRTANAWGTVDGQAEIRTQVLVPGKGWSTSQVGSTNATGGYVIPLTFGADVANDYRWRLVIDHAHGEREFTPEFTQTRVANPTASSAGAARVSTMANVWGTVDVDAPTAVWTEVFVPGKGWSRSQQTTTNATGGYILPLTYGHNVPGAYQFRVAATYPGIGTLYSQQFTFVRTN